MSKLLLVGSVAAKRWFQDFRLPQDVDYLGDEIKVGNKIWTIDERPNYKWLIENYDVATPSLLYTLKVTHSFWDIWWDKTVYDIKFFQRKGVEFDYEIYKRLYKDNEIVHGKKKAYLSKTNEEFFKDGVERKYVHDDLHKAVAFYNKPLYEWCKLNPALAGVNRELFYQLSHDKQIKMALEEIYVTALEREVIPKGIHPVIAAKNAVKQLVTSMTKGWFPLFIMLNIGEIHQTIRFLGRNYVEQFNLALSEGRIRNVA